MLMLLVWVILKGFFDMKRIFFLMLPLILFSIQPICAQESFYIGSGGTDTKPQSKVWFNDQLWWGVFLDGTDSYFYKLDGSTAAKQTFPDALINPKNSGRADTLWNGEYLFVLIWHSTSPQFYKYSYSSTNKSYAIVPGFPVNLNLDTGSETAVLTQDSRGKVWIAYAAGTKIRAIWTTSADHSTWDFEGITLHEGVNSDDVASIVSFDDNVGVMWSNQNEGDFGFRLHRDSDPETFWFPLELVSSDEGIADDHINLATTQRGVVLAATKSLIGSDINLFVRTNSSWQGPFLISKHATRPAIVYDNENSEIYILYTDTENQPYKIVYKKSNLTELIFSDAITLLEVPGVNISDITSTKKTVDFNTGLLAIAKGSDSMAYYNSIPIATLDTQPPTASITADATLGFAPLTVNFSGEGSDNDGFVISYSWDFADGTKSPLQNLSKTFPSPGTYIVDLTVTDNIGATGTESIIIEVGSDPALDVSVPSVNTRSPAPNEVDVSVATAISVTISDAETGINASTIAMMINGVVESPEITGAPSEYLLNYTPSRNLNYSEEILIEILAQDLAAIPNVLQDTFSFTTETKTDYVAKINFQPTSSLVPMGFIPDDGQTYESLRGYGWDVRPPSKERQINPNQSLDTYVYINNTTSATWKYDLPNGEYFVSIGAGSPKYSGIHTIKIEGEIVIDAVATGSSEFVEIVDYPTNITDGQISMTIGDSGSAKKTKVNYVLLKKSASTGGEPPEDITPPHLIEQSPAPNETNVSDND